MRLYRFFLLLLLLLPLPALATPLVADLSNYRIDIDSSFNGTRLFLFGARNDIGDIVAVIRGNNKNYIVRKKEKIAGLWINRSHVNFFNVPDFYAIGASHKLEDIAPPALFTQLGIGEEHILNPTSVRYTSEEILDFSEAFLRYQHTRHLYHPPQQIGFMGETLFKSTIEFPDNIPPGNYTAEIYLMSDGEVSGMQTIPIQIVKSGLDAFLYGFAHESPLSYGLAAVALAIFIGWGTGRLFEYL